MDIGATAWRVELLEYGDTITACAKPDRGGKAPEAAADDDRMRPAVAGRRTGNQAGRRVEHKPNVNWI